MATGISKTQLVLLRGSLRTLVLFGPLYVLVRGARRMRDNGGLTWDTWLGGRAPTAAGCRSPRCAAPWDAGSVTILLDDPSTAVWLHALAPTVIIGALGLRGRVPAAGHPHETYAGQPFFDSSSRRLDGSRVIAIVCGDRAPIAVVDGERRGRRAGAADPRRARRHRRVADAHCGSLVALVVRVIAEAFRIGTELRRDTEGLV